LLILLFHFSMGRTALPAIHVRPGHVVARSALLKDNVFKQMSPSHPAAELECWSDEQSWPNPNRIMKFAAIRTICISVDKEIGGASNRTRPNPRIRPKGDRLRT
jgi:hypothetical protein